MKTTRQNLKSIQINDIDPLLILADLLRTEESAGDTANKLAKEIKSRLEALAGKIDQIIVSEPVFTIDTAGMPSGVMV